MSGIGGIINFNGSPLNTSSLTSLSEELIPRGPDWGRQEIRDNIGFCYRAFSTDHESKNEVQPLVLPNGNIFALDGRLDNRQELLSHFPNGLNGDTSDVALVAASFLKWGGELLPHLIGDFAIAIWIVEANTLLLARDPFGVRPLYYFYDSNRVVWSSTLEALIKSSNIDLEIDDEFVAGFLAIYPELSRTPYKKVRAVEPGFITEFKNGRVLQRRYWYPPINSEIRYQKDEEYADHFYQLFKEAVTCRLRANAPVWAELSGGLDSSSIVCMADKIIEDNSLQHTQLKTISYIDDGEMSYDKRYIDEVEKHRGTQGYHYIRKGHWVHLANYEDEFIERPSVGLCTYGAQADVGKVMNKGGARVLLSGSGGDHLMFSAPSVAASLGDLIFKWNIADTHKQIQQWSKILSRTYWDILWQDGITQFLPISLRAKFQTQLTTPKWINNEFAAKTNITERLLLPDDPFGFRVPSQKNHASSIMYAIQGIAWGHREPHSYIKTFPFLHRPLVEFMLNVPLVHKFHLDETRILLRKALKNILPDKILHRQTKGSVSETICRGVAREWPAIKSLLEGGRVFSRGYIDHSTLITALDKARHGMELELSAFSKVIALEIWLRSIEYHKQGALGTHV